VTQRLAQVLARPEHDRRVLEREAAGFGEAQPRGMTLEQRDTERTFERTNLFADRGLRDSQPRRSAGDRTFECSDMEIIEVVVVQHVLTPRSS
jgi:hypothetical protein